MQTTTQSTTQWAEDNFRSCQLGDKRRNNRLIHVAGQVASNPAASLPGQTETWSDLKGAYNLFDRPEVTFEAIARPHWELTIVSPLSPPVSACLRESSRSPPSAFFSL